MELYQKLIYIYPELADNPRFFIEEIILLQDDGKGPYIKEWKYEKPMPTQKQLQELD